MPDSEDVVDVADEDLMIQPTKNNLRKRQLVSDSEDVVDKDSMIRPTKKKCRKRQDVSDSEYETGESTVIPKK